MRVASLLALTMCCLSTELYAQSAESLLGRDVRIWSTQRPMPVAGVVTHSTQTFIRLSTGSLVCDATGCARSFSTPWREVERVQVNSHTRRDRLLRAALIGGGSGAILAVGIGICSSGRRTRGQIDACRNKTIGLTISAAAIGLIVSKPSWEDVALPELIR
jgi:hypothetical protein